MHKKEERIWTTVAFNIGFFKEKTIATLKEPQRYFTNTGLCSGHFLSVCLAFSQSGLYIEAWLANSNQHLGFVLSVSLRRRKASRQFEEEGTNAKHLDPPNPAKPERPSANYEYTTERETYHTSQELNRIWLFFKFLLKICWLCPTNFLIQLFYSPWINKHDPCWQSESECAQAIYELVFGGLF